MNDCNRILPGDGIAGAILGMSQEEVRAALGNPSEMSTETFDDGTDWVNLDYEKLGLSFGFSSDEGYVLDLIRVERDDMELFGQQIGGLSCEEVMALFESNGEEPDGIPLEQTDDEGQNILTCDFEGVSVWFLNDALCMVQITPRWRDDDTQIFPHRAEKS